MTDETGETDDTKPGMNAGPWTPTDPELRAMALREAIASSGVDSNNAAAVVERAKAYFNFLKNG